MDIKQIQELVKLINKTNIGEITIEEEGIKITIKQKKDPVQHIIVRWAVRPFTCTCRLLLQHTLHLQPRRRHPQLRKLQKQIISLP